ncbi:hypothetical protein [Stenotrophomonas pigmentata]|uniref:hypothetical protein n=1 Tax=Stenotrophomonas pigmentata TaxID=3055080 RepID=UPI0026EA5F5D|nr:hypothetical protein [Stenotrophomonas sp. 610A2]
MSALYTGGARRQLEHDGKDAAAAAFDIERVQGGESEVGGIEHGPHGLACRRGFA